MATVYNFLPSSQDFYAELQRRNDYAESQRNKRFKAVILLQKVIRGYLIRKHINNLRRNAKIIQYAFRIYQAKKAYRLALHNAVRMKHAKHYARAATILQALWRGHFSRRTRFCYVRYRRWLVTVTERGERLAAKAAEFGIRSRADDLRILEEEARQWLAFVVFKLHHLIRTYARAGIYSKQNSNELSDFEKLLKSIHYTEYIQRLRTKYDEFVRKHRPQFSNKRLFPVIGNGSDYWYLSLAEMYELTCPEPNKHQIQQRNKYLDTHHGPMHKKPFLWKRIRTPSPSQGRGPFVAQPSKKVIARGAPAATPRKSGDADYKDPRFHLYLKHYKPEPDIFKYVDFHINALLARTCSIQNINEKV